MAFRWSNIRWRSDQVGLSLTSERDPVLMCRTNGTLAYVGMSALIREDESNMVFPDKLIRVPP